MTDARVLRGQVKEFETIVVENEYLRAVIIPVLGGRVWELEDKVRGRQWVWHREDVTLKASPTGSVYDDVWSGGWEELFPNDAPGRFEGRELPDHGEWWTLPWTVGPTSDGATARVCLTASSSILKAACTKEFSLQRATPTLSVTYRIQSEELEPFHFLFKQHLPIEVTPDCRLLLPGGEVRPVDPTFGTVSQGAGPFAWPMATRDDGSLTDLRAIPPRSSNTREFLYVTSLPEAWCGVEDRSREASLKMTFDAQTLPFLWLFLSYGGWRNTYTAVLEPCTNMPKDLSEAMRLGQSARLDPGQEFVTMVSVTLGGLAGEGL